MKTEMINIFFDTVNTIVGIGILLVAYVQLKKVKEQLENLSDNQRNNTLMTVLELESEMFRRKEAFDNISFEIRFLGESDEKTSETHLEIFKDKYNVSLENYLNSLDRLSYCIIYKYLSDRDWKTEYRDLIFDVVRSYEAKYGTSSRFSNTKVLYEKWKNE